jgi:hypothetical protein
MVDVTPMIQWAVRERLAFTGIPASAIQLARQLDEPLRSVRSALSELAYRGEVAYVGQGRYRALLGA